MCQASDANYQKDRNDRQEYWQQPFECGSFSEEVDYRAHLKTANSLLRKFIRRARVKHSLYDYSLARIAWIGLRRLFITAFNAAKDCFSLAWALLPELYISANSGKSALVTFLFAPHSLASLNALSNRTIPPEEIVRLKLLVFALVQDLCCYCFGEMCDVVEQYNDRCLCGCD